MVKLLREVVENERYSKEKYKYNIRTNDYMHSQTVNGHSVNVMFDGHQGRPGHFDVSYNINYEMSRAHSGVTRFKDKMAVIRHVGKALHGFVKSYKPKGIHASAYDEDEEAADSKADAYHAAFKKMGATTVTRNGHDIHALFEAMIAKMNRMIQEQLLREQESK